MSPIPDVIFIDDEPAEPADARAAEVQRVTNALLKKQQICGRCCHACLEKCEVLQEWVDIDKGE